jgi:hypothetical protein
MLGRLTSDQVRDLDAAVQELRLEIMSKGSSGSGAIQDAFRAAVAGKTLRQLMELGLTAKLDRLEQDRAKLATFITQNAQLLTRDGDAASAEYLARKRDDQLSRLDAIDRDLDETRARMKTFGLTPPPAPPHAVVPVNGSSVVEDHPDTMPQLVRPGQK